MREAEVTTPSVGKEDLLLRSLSGQERLGRPFRYEVELLCADPTIDLTALVGQTMTVNVRLPDGAKRPLHGYVFEARFAGWTRGYSRYVATLRPWVALLAYRTNCRVFQSMTTPEIITAIFKEHGFHNLADFSSMTRSRYRTRDYVVQYRESDLDFVHRLMEQEGLYYYFAHESSKHELIICDSPGAHSAGRGYEKVTFYPEGDDAMREEDHLAQWSVRQEIHSGAVALVDYDFTKPKADLGVKRAVSRDVFKVASPAALKHSTLEVYDYPGLYLATADGESYARDQVERSGAQQAIGVGMGNVRGLACGNTFTLEGHPRAEENREWLVVQTRVHVAVNLYDTGNDDDAEAEPFRCEIETIPAEREFRLPRETPKPRVGGPQTAIVVGPKDKEIWTDEYGRIKVQFHWDREGKNDENSSCWIRVSQAWAGNRWGSIHIPRIGQEVIVDFLEGDPDKPIVTGRVYNADNMPPYALSKNQTQSGIKSHSTLKGGVNDFNEFRFEDAKDKEQVYLQAQKDFDILVKNDETRKVENDRKKDVIKNETTTIGENRTEEVGKDEKITIKGNRTETVEKDETITIKGNRTETVEKDEKITVKGNRTETVEKDETLSIKGNRTETVDKDETTTVKGDQTWKVDGDVNGKIGKGRVDDIAKDWKLTVGGASNATIKGDSKDTVKGAWTAAITKDAKIDTKANMTAKAAQKVTIQGGTEVTLKAGAASITLKASGEVTIKGVKMAVQGSGPVEVKGATVTVKGASIMLG